jgi:DNA-binding MarR family transcriptional regulator
VIFTLGGTDGMTCAGVGEETLITKGTLTGVIDRLRAKGLVERWEDAYDARRTIVALTQAGEALYKSLFPGHMALLAEHFGTISAADRKRATRVLEQISQAFTTD